MISSSNKGPKQYKLDAALPGQTQVTPIRQVVEAAVAKTAKDGEPRVLYLKSTAPSSDQAAQPFVTTKFTSRREDPKGHSGQSRKIAQAQGGTKQLKFLAEQMRDLPKQSRDTARTAQGVVKLCDDAGLFGLPCTPGLLQQLKQLESAQQAPRATPKSPQPGTGAQEVPKVSPVPPLNLKPSPPPLSSASAHSADSSSAEQSSTEHASTDRQHSHRPKTSRPSFVAQRTRLAVKDASTERGVLTPYETWEKDIAALQDHYFSSPSSPASPAKPHTPSDRQPDASPGPVPDNTPISASSPTAQRKALTRQPRPSAPLSLKKPATVPVSPTQTTATPEKPTSDAPPPATDDQ